ncbi:hypothetical protein LXA43DRAFT_372199 [Ganoderma leucocontextum]|nr:hypothetical protein LXA43DRAFT_372199 [Ganoderma leucocontextum]
MSRCSRRSAFSTMRCPGIPANIVLPRDSSPGHSRCSPRSPRVRAWVCRSSTRTGTARRSSRCSSIRTASSPRTSTAASGPRCIVSRILLTATFLAPSWRLVLGLAKETGYKTMVVPAKPPVKDSILVVSGRRRTEGAVQAIVHARKYHIRGVLKRAFYDLLRNATFWDAVRVTHTNSGVARAEVEQRCSADSARCSRGDLVRLQH